MQTLNEPPFLSVVIPCHNESENIQPLWDRVVKTAEMAAPGSFEIIMINDGSTDDTWEKIETLQQSNRCLVGIDLSRNFGHQIALTSGLHESKGERVFVIDADLQDPPEALIDMLKLMDDNGADVVYGKRTDRHGESALKLLTASYFYRLLDSLTDIEIPLDTGDFRLMSRRIVDAFKELPEEHRFIRGMVSWLGFKQIPYEYSRSARLHGSTSYPFKKMVNFAIDGITGFTIRPLRTALYVGSFCIFLALCMAIWVVYNYLSHNTVAGWSSIMVVVLILGALQMVFLGLIGEYVGRTFIQAKRRPLYVIRTIIGRSSS